MKLVAFLGELKKLGGNHGRTPNYKNFGKKQADYHSRCLETFKSVTLNQLVKVLFPGSTILKVGRDLPRSASPVATSNDWKLAAKIDHSNHTYIKVQG